MLLLSRITGAMRWDLYKPWIMAAFASAPLHNGSVLKGSPLLSYITPPWVEPGSDIWLSKVRRHWIARRRLFAHHRSHAYCTKSGRSLLRNSLATSCWQAIHTNSIWHMILPQVRESASGGATIVQIRDKGASTDVSTVEKRRHRRNRVFKYLRWSRD
jgi:hypothetical protein